MTNKIQQARDVLAKWREDAEDGPWRFSDEGEPGWIVRTTQPQLDIYGDPFGDNVGAIDGYHDARLIVGTAGNLDLLNAIDGMLERAAGQYERGYQGGWNDDMASIAAAIIAADERMSA